MFEFKVKVEDEWKGTDWGWFTLDSFAKDLSSGAAKANFSRLTMDDTMRLKVNLGGLATGRSLAHRGKRNTKAAAKFIKDGQAQSITELFTAGCPKCNHRGEDIPREQEIFKNIPPGLYCPECKIAFPSQPIYWQQVGFLVAAGPSLDKNVLQLKRVEGKYPIFVVDTALPTVQKNGIKPTYVVCVEQDPLINRMKIESDGITLLATTSVDPAFRRSWKGPVYLFSSPVSAKKDIRERNKLFKDLGWASPGGNVSTMTFSMMTGLLLSKIILVGHDFSYETEDSYYPQDGPKTMVPLKEIFRTHDLNGKTVHTDLSLYGYKHWTETMVSMLIKDQPLKVINATEGGILGAQYYDPKHFIKFNHWQKELIYKLKVWKKERRWSTNQEAQEEGFKAKNLDCFEYMTLKEAIDKYCPLALKE